MIDKVTFSDMYDNFDKEVVVEIIDIFINEHKGRLNAIHDAILKHDFGDVSSFSFMIMRNIECYFEEEARSMAYLLYNKVRKEDYSGLMEDFEKLTHAVEGLVEELKEIRKQYV